MWTGFWEIDSAEDRFRGLKFVQERLVRETQSYGSG